MGPWGWLTRNTLGKSFRTLAWVATSEKASAGIAFRGVELHRVTHPEVFDGWWCR